MRKVRDLLAAGAVLETKVRRELMRDYEHGRALRSYQRELLAARRYQRRTSTGENVDGVQREIVDLQKAADVGRHRLAGLRINGHVRRGNVIREVGPDGLVYLRWVG